ncbi:unnamed protein product [Brassica oleracea]|uniref:(rape) hypothetical protein n=1 Tax=Brassica napus TaxID=3708 RepID=A0A816U2Z3_BRANA|nr:unnamed protein product [Brassica napus]
MGVDTLWVDGKVDRDMRVTTDRSYITVNSKARRAEIQRALMLQCTSDAQVMTIGRNGARSAWNCQWFNIAMVDAAMKAASSVKMTKTQEAIT